MSMRRFMYSLLSYWNDLNAIWKGKVMRRIARGRWVRLRVREWGDG